MVNDYLLISHIQLHYLHLDQLSFQNQTFFLHHHPMLVQIRRWKEKHHLKIQSKLLELQLLTNGRHLQEEEIGLFLTNLYNEYSTFNVEHHTKKNPTTVLEKQW